MTKWRIRIACWITNATHTRTRTHAHTEYAILIAFPLQQWLHERAPLEQYIHFLSSLSCERRSSCLIECWDEDVMRKDGLKLGCSCLSIGGKVFFSVRSRISLPCSHELVCGSRLERDKSRRHSNLLTPRFIKIPFCITSCPAVAQLCLSIRILH